MLIQYNYIHFVMFVVLHEEETSVEMAKVVG